MFRPSGLNVIPSVGQPAGAPTGSLRPDEAEGSKEGAARRAANVSLRCQLSHRTVCTIPTKPHRSRRTGQPASDSSAICASPR